MVKGRISTVKNPSLNLWQCNVASHKRAWWHQLQCSGGGRWHHHAILLHTVTVCYLSPNSLPDTEWRCGAGVALGLSELLQLTPHPASTSVNEKWGIRMRMGNEKREGEGGWREGWGGGREAWINSILKTRAAKFHLQSWWVASPPSPIASPTTDVDCWDVWCWNVYEVTWVTQEHKIIWCTDMHLYAHTFNVSLSTVLRFSRVSHSSLQI